MSLSRRDSPFANAGLVVEVRAGGLRPERGGAAGRGGLPAPDRAGGVPRGWRRLPCAGAATGRLPRGASQRRAARDQLPARRRRRALIEEMFPPFVAAALRAGLAALSGGSRRFLHPDAVLMAAETRTSAPVRIPRDPGQPAVPALPGLYPVGEGAGYAGGIVSAALDGARAAAAILAGSARTDRLRRGDRAEAMSSSSRPPGRQRPVQVLEKHLQELVLLVGDVLEHRPHLVAVRQAACTRPAGRSGSGARRTSCSRTTAPARCRPSPHRGMACVAMRQMPLRDRSRVRAFRSPPSGRRTVASTSTA